MVDGMADERIPIDLRAVSLRSALFRHAPILATFARFCQRATPALSPEARSGARVGAGRRTCLSQLKVLQCRTSRPSRRTVAAGDSRNRCDDLRRSMPPEQIEKCPWSQGVDAAYERYHDTEWGVPVRDDRTHFEFLVLEGAQAGLSWRTILRKREAYRRAFSGFDPNRVARFNARSVDRLLGDAGIVRNRQKIEATIVNARCFLAIQDEFGTFDAYIWRFVGGKTIRHRFRSLQDLPAKTAESDAMSKDLKTRGFNFVGSTICYAYMQAAGMVNDHVTSCFRHHQVMK